MPAQIFPYIRGLLQGHNITTTFLQQQFGHSHDQLTRILSKSFPWETLIVWVIHRLFGILSGGYLLIDDTVIAKPYAKKLEGASFAYSSCLKQVVYGYHVVVVCWTNETITIPLCWKIWRQGGPTKVTLAKQLLVKINDDWKINPEYVLFDSWYAATKLLNQIHRFHWLFICRIKKNRVINCCPINQDLIKDSDSLIGPITGLFKGRILRHEGKYFLSNLVEITNEVMITTYGMRWKIEEVFRFLKNQVHLQECQARSRAAQQTHLGCCILAYLLVLKEQQTQTPDSTLYAIRHNWLLNRRLGNNRIRHYVKVLTA